MSNIIDLNKRMESDESKDRSYRYNELIEKAVNNGLPIEEREEFIELYNESKSEEQQNNHAIYTLMVDLLSGLKGKGVLTDDDIDEKLKKMRKFMYEN